MKKEKSTSQVPAVQPPEGPKIDPKTNKSHWKFRLIVVALILIIGGGIYRNLQMKKEESAKIPANALFVPKMVKEKKIEPVLPEIKETLPNPEEIKVEVQKEQQVLSLIEQEAKQDPQLAEEIKQDDSSQVPDFGATEALIFRDHFISEAPCGEDFRKLILSEKKTKTIGKVIKTTSSFCLTTNNVYDELRLSFRAAKKKALVALYKQDPNPWKARIKSILAHVIKVRNLNPTEETVEDTLDRAHNALEGKNIALTVEMIGKLPENLQPYFTDFLARTKDYIEAKKALDELVLSYTKGGK